MQDPPLLIFGCRGKPFNFEELRQKNRLAVTAAAKIAGGGLIQTVNGE
jgi:hypothetical protein